MTLRSKPEPQASAEADPGSTYPLEPSREEIRRRFEQAMERVVEHLEALPRLPASDLEGGEELARSLVEPLPEEGEALEKLLGLLFDPKTLKGFTTTGPGFLAYIPGGGIFDAALADLVAGVINRYVTVWMAAPGLAELEANVIRWLVGMVGYPEGARGFLTSGGSLANFTALVTARRERLPEDFLHGTLYASDQVHHSVARAAVMAGFPPSRVRLVASDDRFRLDLEDLRRALRDDRAAGLQPFFLAASAGTTNTGAVDDLEALAELSEAEELWLHVDAAYGGFFALTERGREAMRGLERADSVTLDPHKGLFLPYGTGCLLVRDGEALRRAHHAGADYLPTFRDTPEFVDFCEISPELSRGFRGLRLWLPLKIHGAGVFRQALDEKLDLARWAADELRRIEGMEIVTEPQFSLFAFRLHRLGLSAAELDQLNRDLLDAINRRRRIFLTGTRVRERFVLRICVLSFRTHQDRMRQGLDDIREAVAEVTEGRVG